MLFPLPGMPSSPLLRQVTAWTQLLQATFAAPLPPGLFLSLTLVCLWGCGGRGPGGGEGQRGGSWDSAIFFAESHTWFGTYILQVTQ